MPCNSRLTNITIKISECCESCNEIYDIPHFLLLCPNVKAFWKSWVKWWFSITNSYIRHIDHLQDNILFGFVDSYSITDVLNYCILYAKYYIYIQRLFNQRKLDVYACLTLLRNAVTIEWQINISNTQLDKFEKLYMINYAIDIILDCIIYLMFLLPRVILKSCLSKESVTHSIAQTRLLQISSIFYALAKVSQSITMLWFAY